jgi:hypothetical protein
MKIKGLTFSDVHLGHGRVLAPVIHENIRRTIYPQLNDELDILFIVGDFFDGLLDMNGQAGWVAYCIIAELIELAKKHKFLIRVVRGTFSHDRMQNQWFETESEPTYIGEDLLVRVFNNISIEHINGLDIDIMYVPDDLPYEDAMPVIRETIAEHQLQKVDILLNHGYFSHLLPKGIPHEPPNTFKAENFDELVRGVVLNGHIHQPGVYRKVISHGSFERLAHGEEEAKGCFVIYYDNESGKCSHEFLENKNATTFKTFDLTKWRSESEVLSEYGGWLKHLLANDISTSNPIFIRIICDDAMLKQAVLTFTREQSERVILSSKKSNRKSEDNEDGEDIRTSTVDLPIITEDNLSEMVVEFLARVKNIDTSLDEVEGVIYHDYGK